MISWATPRVCSRVLVDVTGTTFNMSRLGRIGWIGTKPPAR